MSKIPSTQEMRGVLREKIRSLANEKGVQEVAQNAGVTEPTIHNAISHNHRVKLETLESIVSKNS